MICSKGECKMNIEYCVDEIARYRKKKNSSSKSDRKSNHKHIYIESLFHVEGFCSVYIGEYCSICGKIGSLKHETIKDSRGYYIMLSDAEMREKYKAYDEFELENFIQKYIPIGEVENRGEDE